jgi:DNA-binding transcriptional regulator YiaG
MTIAEEIRALRAALKEDTTTFGGRWLCSRRTVEDWEQGRRRPSALALDGIRKLAARTKTVKARRAKKRTTA